MSPLTEIQERLAAYLLSVPAGRPNAELLRVIEPHPLGAEQQLAVYKNNVHSRLVEALADTFPAVVRLVGDEFFRFAAREFASAHPPRRPTLVGYGVHFPGFLRDFEPAAAVPYLPDVAELEYLYLSAYHAAEAVPLSRAEFSVLLRAPDERSRLALHPSARLMTSPHPVSRIWEINVRSEPIDGKVRIAGEREHLLIIRPRASVEVRRVSAAAWRALAVLGQGEGYAAAVHAALSESPRCDIDRELASLAAGETFCLEEHDA